MKKRLLTIILVFAISLSLIPARAYAAAYTGDAAVKLNTLGLFHGVGVNPDGSADYALDRGSTRAEAVTMLVRLFGMETEALSRVWATPFSDVPEWAKPYVGYAYSNGLAFGATGTLFGSAIAVTASEYITFVLRALGYTSGTDFEPDKAWELSDELGFTGKRYDSATVSFLRGDIAEISFEALRARHKESGKTLCSSLIEAGVFTEEKARTVGLGDAIADSAPVPVNSGEPDASEFETAVFNLINIEREKQGLNALIWDTRLADVAVAYSIDMEQRNFFSHVDPDGKNLSARLQARNISYSYSGESLAHGHRTPESVVTAWMNSAGHRNALLSSHAAYIGVGFSNYYWTVELIG